MRKQLTLFALVAGSACTPEPGSSRTSSMVASDPASTLVVGTKLGDELSKEVAISGRDRVQVPNTRDWSCGRPLNESYASNIAWIELVNPSRDTVDLSVELHGLERTWPSLYVYESKHVPLNECLTLSTERKLTGASAVVVEPSSSAFVLISAGSVTGVYTMAVRTEHVLPP